MKLLILRHAEAELGANHDADRRLTTTGMRQASDMQATIARLLGACPVLSSPWQRAFSTAEQLSGQSHDVSELLTPSGQPVRVAEMLEARFDRAGSGSSDVLVVVTHQPLCGYLINWLCEGRADPLAISPCSGALLELDWPAAGMARLVRWFGPDMLP